MKKIIFILLILLVGCTVGTSSGEKETDIFDEYNIDTISNSIQFAIEIAYFQGQYDAINGNIKIENSYGTWRWKEPLWNNGQKTLFDPPRPVDSLE